MFFLLSGAPDELGEVALITNLALSPQQKIDHPLQVGHGAALLNKKAVRGIPLHL
jgi:hypothetical protein